MEATKVRIIFGLTSTISSGKRKMVAPNFRATEIAYLAFNNAFSSLCPSVTYSESMIRYSIDHNKSKKNTPVRNSGSLKDRMRDCFPPVLTASFAQSIIMVSVTSLPPKRLA